MEEVYLVPDHAGSFGSIQSLSKYSKRQLPEAQEWLVGQDAYTLHKPIRRKFRRRQTFVPGINHLWQLDLADVSNIARYNDKNNFILTCIDCFSRYAYAVPVRNKSAPEVKSAFARILEEAGTQPVYVQTDKGREFVNAIFLSYLSEKDI